MAKDPVAAVLEKTDGKRAKTKALEAIPKGTKSAKLPANVAKAMAEKFPKADFGKVKVHTGPEATEACKKLGAQAFAHGPDIFFANPSSAKDSKLLAHELSHVVQQGGGKVPSAKNGKVLTSK